jgi:hypothetical protein
MMQIWEITNDDGFARYAQLRVELGFVILNYDDDKPSIRKPKTQMVFELSEPKDGTFPRLVSESLHL